MSRDGPGQLYAEIVKGDTQVQAIASIIAHMEPDVIALTDFDYDADALALGAFQAVLEEKGLSLPHAFAPLTNGGRPSGLDIDQDGRSGEPEDAIGYGRFWGDSGIAVLSRWPLTPTEVDIETNWADVEGAEMPVTPHSAELGQLPVSTSGHLTLSVTGPGGEFTVLTSASTAPVFDGAEDRNGYRNAAELFLWRQKMQQVEGPFVLAFNANLDPNDGEGWNTEIRDFLNDPLIIDAEPISQGAIGLADEGHLGPPELDTVDWPGPSPGNLRVSYVLPSRHWTVGAAGVFWPDPSDPFFELLGNDQLAAGPHRLVWVDIELIPQQE